MLWTVLRYVGMDALSEQMDKSINLGKRFHTLLDCTNHLKPGHLPDLNLLCFRYHDRGDEVLSEVH